MATSVLPPITMNGLPPQQEAVRTRDTRVAERLLRTLLEVCPVVLQRRGEALISHEHTKALQSQHPEFAAADLRKVATHWVVLAAVFAVFAIDICLMSAVAEYLALMVFPGRPNWVLAARIVASVGVGILEIFIASMLQSAEEHAEEHETNAHVWAWRLLALAWAGFITLCVYKSQQAAGAEEEVATRHLMYGLAGFAFVMHCLLLLAHRQLHEAKGYGLYRYRMAGFNRSYRNARRGENSARHGATVTFQRYAPLVNRLQVPAGPFSVAARQVVNEIFGTGTIPGPDAPANHSGGGAHHPPQPPRAPETPPAHGTNDGPVEGETEYYRTILERRQRDEESEVRF